MNSRLLLVSALALLTVSCTSIGDNSLSKACDGVTVLAWKTEARGTNVETALKVALELAGAAEQDAGVALGLTAGNLEGSFESSFAKVIKENVTQSSEVDSGIWNQNVNFAQAACFAQTLLDRDDLTPAQTERALATVDLILRSQIMYTTAHEEEKKKATISC